MESHSFTYNHPFTLECGDTLPGLQIAYHCSAGGPQGRKVIWICHALTANSNPQEWWDTLVGPGLYFDTERYFIICANMIGSCYGSTGPLSLNPHTHQPYLLDFPLVTIRDMVRAHELLRAHLGLETIDLVTGGSSGGFQAVEWAIMDPKRIKNLCLISCNARVSAWGTAWNESQRMAIEADASFRNAPTPTGGAQGLAAARAMALISYRSFSGYCHTQSEADQDCLMAHRACSYQQHQGQKLVNRFDAYSYYYLTKSLDSHNVGRHRGGVAQALATIQARTLCIAIDSDVLFPLSEIEAMARAIPQARLAVISSAFGHDGFLLEYKQISEQLCKYLNLEELR